MISWRDYRNQTDRVAASIIEAVKSYAPRDGGLVSTKRVAYVQQYAIRLARQVALQGLQPEDIDSANDPLRRGDPLSRAKGVEVLEAIAAAIFAGARDRLRIDGIMGPFEAALKSRLPVEWKHVVDAVARLLDRAVAAKLFDL